LSPRSRPTLHLLLGALVIALVGARRARADGDAPPAAPLPASRADAALGVWGGAIGTKSEVGGTLDTFVLRIDRKSTDYSATTRAEITMPMKRVVVLTDYEGRAKGDGILFQSTERRRVVNGGAPERLDPASLQVTEKDGHVEARVGNDKEGYTDFTLVRKADGDRLPDAGLVRGEWGGEMPHEKLSEKVILDEMYVNLPAEGPWEATVRMECTVLVGAQKVPVTVIASYRDGHVTGNEVRFAIVPWHRTVPSTGQKNDLVGNPLVLRVTDDGKLAGQFEGDDGWPFTLVRRGEAPAGATRPKADTAGFDDLAGAWGGDFSDAKLKDELLIRTGKLALAGKSGEAWTAKLEFEFVVKTAGGDVLVKVDGTYPPGAVEGDAIKFPATKLTRTIVSTGAQNPIDGNPLELRREPDGRLETKFVGAGGFTLTMVRR